MMQQLAHVYSPNGKSCGNINIARLLQLHQAFKYTRRHEPQVHQTHNSLSFEHAIARLLRRYTEKSKSVETQRLKHHWATPDAL